MDKDILIEKIKYLSSMPHSVLVEHCIYLENENKIYEKEIERLNNIMEELEKYIEEMRIYYCKELVENHNCIDLFIESSNKLSHIVNIKLKLKELKGDKND